MYIPDTFFSTDIFWSCLKWLMILLVWGIFAFGTWREDRNIKKLLATRMEERDAVGILRTLHHRDMRIWLQVSLLLVVMAANDIHRDAALLPADFFVPSPPPAAVVTPKVEESPTDMYDKVIHKSAASALPFSNITEFNESNGKREAYIDWLKEHYETWLVTYYYLQKCKKTEAGDYDFIHRMLVSDLAGAHADKTVEGNIMLAATGSYNEMYNDIPCDGAHLSATKITYDANMQQTRLAQARNGADKPSAAAKPASISH